MFGKKRKLAKLNETTKARVLNNVYSLINECTVKGDSAMVRKLDEIVNSINKQQGSLSYEVVITDYKILRYLEDLEYDISKNNMHVAEIRLENIETMRMNRQKQCASTNTALLGKKELKNNKLINKTFKNFDKKFKFSSATEQDIKIDELYTEDQQVKIELYRQQDKVTNLRKKIEELEKKSALNDEIDVSVQSDLDVYSDELDTAEKMLQILSNDRGQKSLIEQMKKLSDAQKASAAKSGFTKEDLEVARNAYDSAVKEIDETKTNLEEIRRARKGGSAAAQTYSAAGASATSSAASSSAQVNTMPPIEEYKFVRKSIEAYEKMQNEYNEYLREKGAQLKEVDAKLAALVLQTENMSKTDQRLNIGEIDQLDGRSNALMRDINLVNQKNAIITDKLNIARGWETELELYVKEEKASRYAGGNLITDFQKAALDFRKRIELNNEQKQIISTAAVVANSVEPDYKSATGTESTRSGADDNHISNRLNEIKGRLGI